MDGKLNHMSCMPLMLKWNIVQRPKCPSFNPTASHFLFPNFSIVFGHTHHCTATNFQAWDSQSKSTHYLLSHKQKLDHKHKFESTHTRSTNTNLNQSITKICRVRERERENHSWPSHHNTSHLCWSVHARGAKHQVTKRDYLRPDCVKDIRDFLSLDLEEGI